MIDPLLVAAEIAQAFGLVVKDVLDYVRQRHPELRAAPPPDAESAIDAEIDAKLRNGER